MLEERAQAIEMSNRLEKVGKAEKFQQGVDTLTKGIEHCERRIKKLRI